MKRTTYLHF